MLYLKEIIDGQRNYNISQSEQEVYHQSIIKITVVNEQKLIFNRFKRKILAH